MSEQLKTAAQNLIEKGFNQKDPSAFESYFSPALKDHALPPGMPEGFEGRKMFYSAMLAAFPDMQVRIEDVLAEGNKLVTRWSAEGTQSGELMGIPATGKKVSISGIAIDRFENGQSVEHWEIFDQMGLMQQLGVVPG
ncbi:MAG TPA: ester cyclase [Anaerolineales bacterium]|nr:ester cyclase [Anaerolineales bacterium]